MRTDAGDIEAEIVVNCAGQWAKQVGAMAGVNVPLHSAEHFYVVTEHIDGVHPDLPILRDPDGYTYFKEEVGGLVIGGFEPEAKPWVSPDAIPYPFEFQLLEEDWDHFEILMNNALLRIPALEVTGIKKFYNGPESFTPDNQFILGEAPEVANFFVGAGFNSVGHRDRRGCRPRACRVDRQRSADQRPHRRRHPPVRAVQRQQPVAARPGRGGARHALRNPMAQPGNDDRPAVPSLAGAPPAGGRGRQLRQQDGLGARQLLRARRVQNRRSSTPGASRTGLAWSAAEQTNTRTNVTVFDQTSFSKYLLVGRDAEAALQWLCTADVGVEVGPSVYTGMLNERGTYESDVTVTRTGPEEFLIVSSAATTERDKDHIRKNLPAGAGASLVDVTSAYAVFGVMGPKSRDLLSALTSADLSDDAFPFGTSRQISLGYATVRATRITYVGELGWELYVPAEFAVGVYEDLMAAGRSVRRRPRRLLHDRIPAAGEGLPRIRPGTDAEREPRRGRACCSRASSRTDIAFLGREAVEKAKAEGPRKKLVGFTVDSPEAMLWGGELILRDGAVAGQVTSAAWGETTGSCVGLGLRACVRQLRHQRRLGQSRQLRGQRRRTAVSGLGVAEAALRPDERANTPVARRPGRRCTGWLRSSGCSATSRLCSMGVASTSGTPASDVFSWRCWSTSNRPVPADQLIDRVWADEPSASGAKRPGGIPIAVASGVGRRRRADRPRARRLHADGRCIVGGHAPVPQYGIRRPERPPMLPQAAALFDSALELWRGEPFASLDTPWINDVRNALEAERLSVTLDRNDAALQVGRHAELLGELVDGGCRAHPLDERLAGQLMLAQYRCGRQAGALETYRLMRERLVEELGVDPSPTLREVHQQILDGDQAAPHPKRSRAVAGSVSSHCLAAARDELRRA